MKNACKPGKKLVLEQLERIVASADFNTSARSREFLRYVVEALEAGRELEISQHAIAIQVFGRGGDFDPIADPIVRMQAGRVRRSLEHYYLTEGMNDPLIISLPKGTYVPAVELREVPKLSPSPSGSTRLGSAPAAPWPTLLLTPFHNLTSDPAADSIARGLVLELASELNNYPELRFLLGASEADAENPEVAAQFAVQGEVGDGGDGWRISVRLLNGKPATLVWAHTYSTHRTGKALGAFLDELASALASAIAGERGMVARYISQGVGRRQTELDAYGAILRYQDFIRSPCPESYRAAITALQTAVKDHPDCGCCWSFLARLCADDYALWISGNPAVIEDALRFAAKGVQLAPTDQRARGIRSYLYLLNDQVEEARREAEAALALNPNSLFVLDGIGYVLTLCGDWEHGPVLSRNAVELNPFHMPVVHAGLWLDAVCRNDFEEAHWQALEFSPQEVFWQPLMQAVALAFLGRRAEAILQADRIIKLQPCFLERSSWLIRRYVKFDELVERIEDGLRRAGLPVKSS